MFWKIMNASWYHYIIIQPPLRSQCACKCSDQWNFLLSLLIFPSSFSLSFFLFSNQINATPSIQSHKGKLNNYLMSLFVSALQPVSIGTCPLSWQFCILNISLIFSHFITGITVLVEVQKTTTKKPTSLPRTTSTFS